MERAKVAWVWGRVVSIGQRVCIRVEQVVRKRIRAEAVHVAGEVLEVVAVTVVATGAASAMAGAWSHYLLASPRLASGSVHLPP